MIRGPLPGAACRRSQALPRRRSRAPRRSGASGARRGAAASGVGRRRRRCSGSSGGVAGADGAAQRRRQARAGQTRERERQAPAEREPRRQARARARARAPDARRSSARPPSSWRPRRRAQEPPARGPSRPAAGSSASGGRLLRGRLGRLRGLLRGRLGLGGAGAVGEMLVSFVGVDRRRAALDVQAGSLELLDDVGRRHPVLFGELEYALGWHQIRTDSRRLTWLGPTVTERRKARESARRDSAVLEAGRPADIGAATRHPCVDVDDDAIAGECQAAQVQLRPSRPTAHAATLWRMSPYED